MKKLKDQGGEILRFQQQGYQLYIPEYATQKPSREYISQIKDAMKKLSEISEHTSLQFPQNDFTAAVTLNIRLPIGNILIATPVYGSATFILENTDFENERPDLITTENMTGFLARELGRSTRSKSLNDTLRRIIYTITNNAQLSQTALKENTGFAFPRMHDLLTYLHDDEFRYQVEDRLAFKETFSDILKKNIQTIRELYQTHPYFSSAMFNSRAKRDMKLRSMPHVLHLLVQYAQIENPEFNIFTDSFDDSLSASTLDAICREEYVPVIKNALPFPVY